ncbi:MAG: hypothetical protein V4733_10720 [Verrucomicrobiota bacterium]
MKIALFSFLTTLAAPAGERVILFRERPVFINSGIEHSVSREDYERVRSWEPKAGSAAPLTSAQAVSIARSALAGKIDDHVLQAISLCEVNLYEKDIVKQLPVTGTRWFYLVSFTGKRPAPTRCVVTMSGVAASRRKFAD